MIFPRSSFISLIGVLFLSKREYFNKRIDPEKDKKRLASFEQGKSYGEEYNFLKLLRQNEMTWNEYPGGYGLITHVPTRLTIRMEVSPLTRIQHKCYCLDKLKDKVSTHLYKLEQNNIPVNILV